MKVEIDDTVLLKIDYSLKKALYFLRSAKGQDTNSLYAGIASVEDDLSDAVCRISEKVRAIKES
jgi:hypothetical protein